MEIIVLNDQEIDWCKSLGLKRSASVNHADTNKSVNMIDGMPPWHRHFVGVCGELAYGKFTNQPVDDKTIGRGDSGSDFSDGSNVKSSDLLYRPNLFLRKDQWLMKHSLRYVLAWVKLPEVHLLGWITREKAEEVKQECRVCKVPSWVIPFYYLESEFK